MAEGTADIIDATYPSSVPSGQSFEITYTITNIGGSDLLWGGILDYSTNSWIPGSAWLDTFGAGETKTKSFTMSITSNLSAMIQAGHELADICLWVSDRGGATGLDVTEVFQFIDSYIFSTPPTGYTFVPTIMEVFGIIDYYIGFIDSGNQKTGCS